MVDRLVDISEFLNCLSIVYFKWATISAIQFFLVVLLSTYSNFYFNFLAWNIWANTVDDDDYYYYYYQLRLVVIAVEEYMEYII